MKNIDINGAITLDSERHTIEYEPGQMTGLSVLYLRIKDGKTNVPIHVSQIDSVIGMLQAGKEAIIALEKTCDA